MDYDSFGYIATSNKDAFNLLVIPDYNVIVTKKDGKYGIINSSGLEIIRPIADDIYMTINSDKKYYYLNIMDKRYDLVEYLDQRGVKTTSDETESTTSGSTNDGNTINGNTINGNTANENTYNDNTSNQNSIDNSGSDEQ